MRKEVEQWMLTAEDDFKTAEHDFSGKHFKAAAFWCQQSIEKALKALFLHKKKTEVPKSHSLSFLAKETHVPSQFHPFLGELTPKFITTRYPDVAGDLPSVLYSEGNTRPIIEQSKEVLAWIRSKLSGNS